MGDYINAIFEGLNVLFVCLSIKKLFFDKLVRGISIYHITFIVLWGFWNIYYYPSLGQWLSFSCGIGLVIVNSIWYIMMIYYIKKEKLYEFGIWKTDNLDHWLKVDKTTTWLLRGHSPCPNGNCSQWTIEVILNGNPFVSNIKGSVEELKKYIENNLGLIK